MNALPVLKYVLLAGVCIVGTTALWSAMHPTMDCPECKCDCPRGNPGLQGKDGMDCQLFDDNGKLACRYADGSTRTTDIPTKEALAGQSAAANQPPTYSWIHILVILALTILWIYFLYSAVNVLRISSQLSSLQSVLQNEYPAIAAQIEEMQTLQAQEASEIEQLRQEKARAAAGGQSIGGGGPSGGSGGMWLVWLAALFVAGWSGLAIYTSVNNNNK